MYLIYNMRTKQFMEEENPDFSGEWQHRYGGTWRDIYAWRIYSHSTVLNIPCHEELSGPDGCHFTLFCYTSEHINNLTKAKAKLRQDRDVTGLTIYRGTLVKNLLDS